ncbi:hypothetical protein HY970_00655 [Candidatus Kaiserbacteria bacterium]|nr:hypothetical protein [Candidatus Kaiserbacteria bacterium]
MGRIEKESSVRRKRARVRKVILSTVGAIGYIGLAMLIPNSLGALHKLGVLKNPRERESVKRSFGRLVDAGMIHFDGRNARLTKKGKAQLLMLQMREGSSRKRRWDNRWRVLIFDIPEYRKGLREKMRRTLISVGFARLQDSVWIYPYDCEDLITLLKADFKIGRDVLYMIVEVLENDRWLRTRYNLID